MEDAGEDSLELQDQLLKPWLYSVGLSWPVGVGGIASSIFLKACKTRVLLKPFGPFFFGGWR